MSTTLLVAAGVALAGALVALLVLPGRERERAEKRGGRRRAGARVSSAAERPAPARGRGRPRSAGGRTGRS